MTWHPARTATQAQAKRATELLHSSLNDGSWKDGAILAEENGAQYRAAYHPNKDGSGRHPGVEVWLPAAEAKAMTAPWKYDPSRTATQAERDAVLNEFEKRGWPRDEANAMVAIESGWDPSARNVQGFGGFIGLSPTLQKKWGVHPVWTLSAMQQVPLVGKYLDMVGKKWRVPGDTYLTGAAPAYVGAPDHTVIYPQGSKAWEQNPGWRPPDGGSITAGSIRATLLRKLAKGGGASPKATPKAEATLSFSSPLDFLERLHSAMARENSYAKFSGAEARAHIVAWQRAHDLRGDGLLGPQTLSTLIDDLSRTAPG